MKDSRSLRNLITIALVFAAGVAMAVLFEDGTFETPVPSWEDGTGWEAFGTPDAGAAIGWEDWANGAPGTGGGFGYAAEGDQQFGLAFKGYSASAGGFYHDVPVEPARQYSFHIQSNTALGFYNQVVASGTGSVSIVFAWYDGDPATGGSLVSVTTNDITSLITNGGSDAGFPPGPTQAAKWQNWDYDLTAPGASAYLRSTIQWTAAATVTNGDEVIRWDNAELTTPLDPVNDSTNLLPVLELAYQIETTKTFTVESSTDTQDWDDAGLPGIMGDDTTQRVHVVRDAPAKSYRLNGGPRPPEGILFSDANDGYLEVRDTLPPTNPWPQVHPETLGNWQANVGEWFGQGLTTIVLPFQLPDFGSVSEPFDTAELGVMVNPNSGTAIVTDIDLYGVRADPSPAISTNDWYNGATPDPGATLIQASFLTPASPIGWDGAPNNFTDAPGSANLRAYLNTVYAGGAGANQYVFLRLSYGADTFATGWDAFKINVRESGSPGEWPRITYTGAPLFVFEPTLIPATVSGTVVEWDGQLGVQYDAQYSDDGGTNWNSLFRLRTGTGGRMQTADPVGTVPGRSYRVVTLPPVPRVPGS